MITLTRVMITFSHCIEYYCFFRLQRSASYLILISHNYVSLFQLILYGSQRIYLHINLYNFILPSHGSTESKRIQTNKSTSAKHDFKTIVAASESAAVMTRNNKPTENTMMQFIAPSSEKGEKTSAIAGTPGVVKKYTPV